MSRETGNVTRAILAAAVLLTASVSISAPAQTAAPPNFAPDASIGWYIYGRQFMPPPPASGPGPVQQHPDHRYVTNDEFRVTGRQPTQQIADLDTPILQPWARETLRKRNELVLSGKPANQPHDRCWPVGVPAFLLRPMTQAMYFIQTPEKVLMICADNTNVFFQDPDAPPIPQATVPDF